MSDSLGCPLSELTGVAGSGKHDNFSLVTEEGVNLFCPKSLYNGTSRADAFPLIMAAV